jgi:hypothetical protein
MVTRWGMGADPTAHTKGVTGRGILSAIVVTEHARPSIEVAAAQDRAIRAILDEAYARSRSLLLGRMDLLDAVGGYLYEHERMTGDDFEAIVAGSLAPTSTSDWRSPAASPRPWDEIADVFASQTAIAPAAAALRTSEAGRGSAPRRERRRRSLVTASSGGRSWRGPSDRAAVQAGAERSGVGAPGSERPKSPRREVARAGRGRAGSPPRRRRSHGPSTGSIVGARPSPGTPGRSRRTGRSSGGEGRRHSGRA